MRRTSTSESETRAIAAKLALPERKILCITGDGGFLMNVQELATAKVEKIHAKVIILNNQHLGMVVQWEDRFYAGNRGHTYLGNPEDRAQIYPDYVRVCTSFNVPCERVMFRRDLKAALQRMLASKTAYVLDSHIYEHDEEGYLKNLSDWSKELADLIAKDEKIELTPEHWEVINFLREYYEEYQVAPAIRARRQASQAPSQTASAGTGQRSRNSGEISMPSSDRRTPA